MTKKNQRDEKNWRVPKQGTLSFQIYQLLKQGKKAKEIATLLNKDPNTVYVLTHKIMHPEYHNKISN